MVLVLDTSVLFAALDADDPDHERCAGLLADSDELLVIPSAVLAELDCWVRKVASADAWLSFCERYRIPMTFVESLEPPDQFKGLRRFRPML